MHPRQVRVRLLLTSLLAAFAFFGFALTNFLSGRAHDYPSGVEAIGALEDLSPAMQRAFHPTGHFALLSEPEPGEWLDSQPEPGQTFDQFAASWGSKLSEPRDTIYVQAIGAAEILGLEEYGKRYFKGVDVEFLPPIRMEAITPKARQLGEVEQVLAPDILDYLEDHLPPDAFCVIGLTNVDLYPSDDWNFVYGQASRFRRVGVFSFARNDDAFNGGPPSPPEVIARRALQTMTHEVGHMFGLSHCVFYSCNMNGSSGPEESDAQPPHLCPVCLRKLQHAIGFDPARRYDALAEFYRSAGLEEEAAFVQQRRDYILEGAQSPEVR